MNVLVLYDIDSAWEDFEVTEARKSTNYLYESLKAEGVEARIAELNNSDLEGILKKYNPSETIIFNLCETLPGIPASEIKVLETIEKMGFTYTGNGPEVMELSYNKKKCKEYLMKFEIPVPAGSILCQDEADIWTLFPSIVKPASEHCSLTITDKSVVYNTITLKEQINLVNSRLKQSALVEDFIDGREFHVSVWNNNPPEMLPPAEMDFSAFSEQSKRLCTYDSKFIPGSEHYEKIETILPALLNEKQSAELERIVIGAWKGFGCRDYARFDLRMRDDTFYLLDINPNNDISFDTSFAMAAELSGHSYGQLVKKIVMMAAERHPVFGK